MEKTSLLSLILLFVSTFFISFLYRQFFISTTNIAYLDDLYSHSQWRIPLSSRVISDDWLYQISGYQIVQGADLFSVSPEVPPLGKYFYGWAISAWGNAYIVSLLFYVFTLGIFWGLVKLVFPSRNATTTVALLSLSPVVFSQLSQAMMDLPLLFFFLLHILMLLLFVKSEKKWQKIIAFILASFALGFFCAIKIAVFAPVIFLADLWLLKNFGKLKWTPFLIVGILGSYFASYAPYFWDGHSFFELLKALIWTLHFYLDSELPRNPLMPVLSIFFGLFKNLGDTGTWEFIREWSLLWPFTIFACVFFVRQRTWSKIEVGQKYFLLLIAGLLAMNLVVPFFPRYFLLILPLGLPFVSLTLEKHKVLKLGLFFYLFFKALLFLYPQPADLAQFASQQWQNGNYVDLYQYFTKDSQTQISSENLQKTLKTFENQILLESKSVDIQFSRIFPWQNTVTGKVFITYKTQLGEFSVVENITANRVGRIWKLAWNWNLVMAGFLPSSKFETQVNYPGPGVVEDFNGSKLCSVTNNRISSFIFVDAEKFVNNRQNIDLLAKATNLGYPPVENLILVRWRGLKVIPIGFISDNFDVNTLTQLSQDQNIILKPMSQLGTFYLNESSSSDTLLCEQNKNQIIGEIGGQIKLIQENGDEKIVLEKEMREGKKIIIEL